VQAPIFAATIVSPRPPEIVQIVDGQWSFGFGTPAGTRGAKGKGVWHPVLNNRSKTPSPTMKFRIITLTALAGALLLPVAVRAQSAGTGPGPGPGPVVEGVDTTDTTLPDDLRALIQQFREQRQEILQARQQLIERLRNCTEEERRAIIDAFRQEQRERLQAERELRREIREQVMEMRRNRRQGGRTSG
jgi:hypothetical protein